MQFANVSHAHTVMMRAEADQVKHSNTSKPSHLLHLPPSFSVDRSADAAVAATRDASECGRAAPAELQSSSASAHNRVDCVVSSCNQCCCLYCLSPWCAHSDDCRVSGEKGRVEVEKMEKQQQQHQLRRIRRHPATEFDVSCRDCSSSHPQACTAA